ncbi:MAG: uracil-DNA glycosylase [Caldilineales bacterium]|nr:uracil-DNA glycosylase [Caldilineales bacterium]
MNDVQTALHDLAVQISACRLCPLGKMRSHAVPGAGPHDAEIMFIGEGPGYYEDQRGLPFVGASGELLESLLAEIGMTREQVFIANVIKCRPPNNRDPLPQEIESCRPYLDQQIALLNPLIIVTLGRFSMARFLPPDARITRVHGRPLRQGDRIILPMFHPAAALRNPNWQADMRMDFSLIPGLLDEVRAARAAATPPDDLEQLSLF